MAADIVSIGHTNQTNPAIPKGWSIHSVTSANLMRLGRYRYISDPKSGKGSIRGYGHTVDECVTHIKDLESVSQELARSAHDVSGLCLQA